MNQIILYEGLNKLMKNNNKDRRSIPLDVFKLECIEFNQIIREVIMEIQNNSFLKKYEIIYVDSKDYLILGDKILLKNCIRNLILNLLNISKDNKIKIKIEQVNKDKVKLSLSLIKALFKNRHILNKNDIFTEIIKLHKGTIERFQKGKKILVDIYLPIIFFKNFIKYFFVIYKSGILLFDYSFCKDNKKLDPILVSGGIVGIMLFLKEMCGEEKILKEIDYENWKMIIESNSTGDIYFILIVSEEFNIIRKILKKLIEKFENENKNLIQNIENFCFFREKWDVLYIYVEDFFLK
ncbi:MAG: hypothetical protein ACTSVV_18060 [Promethearchaeota archaeon]